MIATLNQNPSNLPSQLQLTWDVPVVHKGENCPSGTYWMIWQDLRTDSCLIWLWPFGSTFDSERRADSCLDLLVCLVLFKGVHWDSRHTSLRTIRLSPCFSLFSSFIYQALHWTIAWHNNTKKCIRKILYSQCAKVYFWCPRWTSCFYYYPTSNVMYIMTDNMK